MASSRMMACWTVPGAALALLCLEHAPLWWTVGSSMHAACIERTWQASKGGTCGLVRFGDPCSMRGPDVRYR